jgi:hypothetical protein
MQATSNEHGKELLAILLSMLLIVLTMPVELSVAQPPQNAPPPSSYTGQGAPLTEQELNNLVSPIALYPDALVAQILAASTFPDQVAVADNWLQQNKSLTGSTLMQAVNGQSWDPSVKALTQFPSVLNNMAQNLAWTSQLGEVYHNQQSQVMSAIQTLRPAGPICWKPEDHAAADRHDAEPGRNPSHCHPTGEPAGGLCSAIQPDGRLWNAVHRTRLQHRCFGGDGIALLWSGHCGRRHDERRLLRLGV